MPARSVTDNSRRLASVLALVSGCAAPAANSVTGAAAGPSASVAGPSRPALVPRMSVRAVAVNKESACAITRKGDVWCWGQDFENIRQTHGEPQLVAGLLGASQISLGSSGTACAVLERDIACWGLNDSLQVGTGPLSAEDDWRRGFLAPTLVGLPTARGVSVGVRHTCAWLADGTVKCWGNNAGGQLGVGSPNSQGAPQEIGTPTTVSGVNAVVSVLAGNRATCALHRDHTVTCWGEGFACDKPRRMVELGSNNRALTGSDDLFAVLKSDGSVWSRPPPADQTSGRADACSENGSKQQRSLRFQLRGDLTKVELLSMSWDPLLRLRTGNGCALRGGLVQCWQEGPSRRVAGLFGVQQLAVGPVAACAITGAGQLLCWGSNGYGQLGDGSDADARRQSGPVEPHWPVSEP